jgi:hypothetical protein
MPNKLPSFPPRVPTPAERVHAVEREAIMAEGRAARAQLEADWADHGWVQERRREERLRKSLKRQ